MVDVLIGQLFFSRSVGGFLQIYNSNLGYQQEFYILKLLNSSVLFVQSSFIHLGYKTFCIGFTKIIQNIDILLNKILIRIESKC